MQVIVSKGLEKFLNNAETKNRVQNIINKVSLSIEADAKKACPVKTGNLRGSIHTNISELKGEIGTNVEYAPYIEFGTYKQAAKPFLYPALKNNQKHIIRELKQTIGGK